MLMRFGMSNYRSIHEYQELSLIASALKDSGSDIIQEPGVRERLLPAVLIYGANASGKTTVLAGLNFLRGAVLKSHKAPSPNSKIPRRIFALSEEAKSEPTKMDCDFVINGVRYNFGFVANDDFFLEEWLFSFPQGNRRKWYYRKHGEKISFGKFFKGKNHAIAALTRPNSLFLSTAAENAHEQATLVFNFFEQMITPTINAALNFEQIAEDFRDGIDERIISFLRLADTGIKSARVEQVNAPDELTKVIGRIKDVMDTEFNDFKFAGLRNRHELSLAHETGTVDGESVFLKMNMESRGTIRLLKILKPLFKALDSGGTILIDEIDASIHTLLAKQLIELFSSKTTNPRGAQLIATTHDTTLLCSEAIRRDQIWFTEKDSGGATYLYPLSDIKTRNTDNLERGYLHGRFGAVPFLGPIEKLVADSSK